MVGGAKSDTRPRDLSNFVASWPGSLARRAGVSTYHLSILSGSGGNVAPTLIVMGSY